MITKKRLLAGLEEIVYVEEGMVGLYTNFSRALALENENLTDDKRKEMLKLLTVLNRDSARHKETIEELVMSIEKDPINEY